MCRTLSEGGRRCRHQEDTTTRNAARRAAYAATRARQMHAAGDGPDDGADSGGAFAQPPAEPAPEVGWSEAFNQVHAIAGDMQTTMRESSSWVVHTDAGQRPSLAGQRAEGQIRRAGALVAAEVDRRCAGQVAQITAEETRAFGGRDRAVVIERARQELRQAHTRLEELRLAAMLSPTTGEHAHITAQIHSAVESLQPMRRLVETFDNAADEFSCRRMDTRAAAATQLLAEIRPLGIANPSTLYTPYSEEAPRRAVELASAVFPREWVQTSHHYGNPLVLMTDPDRGVYTDMTMVKLTDTGEARVVSLLRVDPRGRTDKAIGYTTALHELTHRFEQNSSARLTDAEAVFMWRRTTDHTTGRPQPFEPYLGDVDEPTRPDGFIDSYFGKHYPGGYGWEVLSTGVESIFAGRFGGLCGEGAGRSDEDHRRFTLGCMATL